MRFVKVAQGGRSSQETLNECLRLTLHRFEVEVIVVAASRIELCVTGRASVGTCHVLLNGQFRSASPA